MRRKKSNDYTMPLSVIGIIVLAAIGSRSPSSFKVGPSHQASESSTIPPFQDDGPTTDGSTTLTISNAIPSPLVFKVLKKGSDRELELNSCQGCKIYKNNSEIPPNVCKLGESKTIAVVPGKSRVHWYYKGAQIGETIADWNLSPGRKYSLCLVMNMSGGRLNWDSK
jgi:hypothetical protein